MNDCCQDWAPNVKIINNYIVLQWVRQHQQYEGKPFVYCPWCGTKRDTDSGQTSSLNHEHQQVR